MGKPIDSDGLDFSKMTPEERDDAIKTILEENKRLQAENEEANLKIQASGDAVNNLPIVTYNKKKYQFTRAVFYRSVDETSTEVTAEAAQHDEKFIKWAVENKSAFLKEIV